MYGQGSIIRRIALLEQKYLVKLPVVMAEYEDGTVVCFEGTPPIGELARKENPVVKICGSEFAEMLNAIIKPVPNRNFDDFE